MDRWVDQFADRLIGLSGLQRPEHVPQDLEALRKLEIARSEAPMAAFDSRSCRPRADRLPGRVCCRSECRRLAAARGLRVSNVSRMGSERSSPARPARRFGHTACSRADPISCQTGRDRAPHAGVGRWRGCGAGADNEHVVTPSMHSTSSDARWCSGRHKRASDLRQRKPRATRRGRQLCGQDPAEPAYGFALPTSPNRPSAHLSCRGTDRGGLAIHSERSARIGSMRVARCAGTAAAVSMTAVRTRTAAPKAGGSTAGRSISRL